MVSLKILSFCDPNVIYIYGSLKKISAFSDREYLRNIGQVILIQISLEDFLLSSSHCFAKRG